MERSCQDLSRVALRSGSGYEFQDLVTVCADVGQDLDRKNRQINAKSRAVPFLGLYKIYVLEYYQFALNLYCNRLRLQSFLFNKHKSVKSNTKSNLR